MLSFEKGNLKPRLYVVLKNEFYNNCKKNRRLIDESKIAIDSLSCSQDILSDYIHDDEMRWLYQQVYQLEQRERGVMLLT